MRSVTLNAPDPTFCGVPLAPSLAALDADAVVFSAAHGSPYEPGTPGVAVDAPPAVRGALEWYSVGREQWDMDLDRPVMGEARVLDAGDIEGDLADGAANRAWIGEVTKAILAARAVPVLLGGDDSVPIPFIDAYAATGKPLTIVQIDAHIDWRDEVRGERYGFSSTMRRASEMAHVAHIIQVGARGPGSARRADFEDAKRWGVRFFTAREVHANGTAPVLAAIPEGAEVILSIDVDGLDPGLVPGVSLPAFGGLGYQRALDIVHGAAAKASIAGAAFVEFIPEKDPHGLGAKTIARLACNVIGSL